MYVRLERRLFQTSSKSRRLTYITWLCFLYDHDGNRAVHWRSLALRFGRKKMVQLSGVLIFTGMMIAVLFPTIVTATIGFLIVGFGVSSIIPLMFSTAGKVKEVAVELLLLQFPVLASLDF
jgi:hypothetical protein